MAWPKNVSGDVTRGGAAAGAWAHIDPAAPAIRATQRAANQVRRMVVRISGNLDSEHCSAVSARLETVRAAFRPIDHRCRSDARTATSRDVTVTDPVTNQYRGWLDQPPGARRRSAPAHSSGHCRTQTTARATTTTPTTTARPRPAPPPAGPCCPTSTPPPHRPGSPAPRAAGPAAGGTGSRRSSPREALPSPASPRRSPRPPDASSRPAPVHAPRRTTSSGNDTSSSTLHSRTVVDDRSPK